MPRCCPRLNQVLILLIILLSWFVLAFLSLYISLCVCAAPCSPMSGRRLPLFTDMMPTVSDVKLFSKLFSLGRLGSLRVVLPTTSATTSTTWSMLSSCIHFDTCLIVHRPWWFANWTRSRISVIDVNHINTDSLPLFSCFCLFLDGSSDNARDSLTNQSLSYWNTILPCFATITWHPDETPSVGAMNPSNENRKQPYNVNPLIIISLSLWRARTPS